MGRMNAPANARAGTAQQPARDLILKALSGARVHGAAQEGLAREAEAFLQKRARDEIKVRIYNPEPDVAYLTVVETLASDVPLLVESVLAALTQLGIDPIFVSHPILHLRRNSVGRLITTPQTAEEPESFIHVHVPRIESDAARAGIAEEIHRTLADAQLIARDAPVMWRRVNEALAACASDPSDEAAEARKFLEWMLAGNFLLMGVRTYRHVQDLEGGRLEGLYEHGLGILRDPSRGVLLDASNPHAYTEEYRAFLRSTARIAVNKSSARSRISQRSEMDYVAVRIPDGRGAVRGELKVLGLFAPNVYSAPLRDIPILSKRAANVIAASNTDVQAHAGKTLVRILEEYPRDELFQMEEQEILARVLDIVPLYGLPRIKAITRMDRFGRFASVLVHVPRDRYDSELRRNIGLYLERAFGGHISEFTPAFPHGTSLARVRFVVRLSGAAARVDESAIEAEIARLLETWPERLNALLLGRGRAAGTAPLGTKYMNAFGAGYRERFDPEAAIVDIDRIEQLSGTLPALFRFYPDGQDQIGLKIYSGGTPMALSARVPMLDAMGFLVVSERTFEIAPTGGEPAWLHDMTLRHARGGEVDPRRARGLEELLEAVHSGSVESDTYNALGLEAAMPIRDIALVRAWSRYLHQTGIAFSQEYMAGVAIRHAEITSDLVALFHARFDPERDEQARERTEDEIASRIEGRLDAVESLDEDRIIRRLLNLVRSMVRTNFFQRDETGAPPSAMAFKFDAAQLEGLPDPKPLYEIFVASPRVDGIHLRFGKVARGGLRWSDRQEDFRTEVLGLVKAQQVKNAVIVPVGAKGGFVAKQLPTAAGREAWLAEGRAAYSIFISSLLDVTDNVVGGVIAPPKRVVRHDPDDPYMVVAADKGTATFSDIANAIALERGFWLGDGFASGGSAGYDHKKMGITARGAWEAIKRHFRETGVDVQTQPFTVAGVGDMSGDVFGNGMLLSRQIRLVAAFDHRHIFIDPDPDAAKSFAERQRLFDEPNSSWADYDAALISEGGGVYSRTAKRIDLSDAACRMLAIIAPASPQQVMNAILKLDVDLLYFGGIGTFVRASDESNAEAGDRGNDAIRITAPEIRARVIGEGANLGLTQRARVEAALGGVRINTDAVDNSAGVNTSDYEVNLKLALEPSVASGRIDRATRDELLVAMAADVVARVLANNHSQTLALSCAQRLEATGGDMHRRLMHALEASKLLDRPIEFLPDDAALARRAQHGGGLTRPELAVLLAYAKNAVKARALELSSDDAYLFGDVRRYFPPQLCDRFNDEIAQHPLRREIAATRIINAMMDLGGPAFVVETSGALAGDIGRLVRAFVVVRDAFGIEPLVAALNALDGRIPPDRQIDLYLRVRQMLVAQTAWMLGELPDDEGLAHAVQRVRFAVDLIREQDLSSLPSGFALRMEADVDSLQRLGVPEQTAREFGRLELLSLAPEAEKIAREQGRDLDTAFRSLIEAHEYFGIPALRDAAAGLVVSDPYEAELRDRSLKQAMAGVREIVSASLSALEEVRGEIKPIYAEDERIAVAGFVSEPSLARLCIIAVMLTDLSDNKRKAPREEGPVRP